MNRPALTLAFAFLGVAIGMALFACGQPKAAPVDSAVVTPQVEAAKKPPPAVTPPAPPPVIVTVHDTVNHWCTPTTVWICSLVKPTKVPLPYTVYDTLPGLIIHDTVRVVDTVRISTPVPPAPPPVPVPPAPPPAPPPAFVFTLSAGACTCVADTTARTGSAGIGVSGSSGAYAVNWTATSPVPWLVLTSSTGHGNGGIAWTLNPVGLAAGQYLAIIRISSPDAATIYLTDTLVVGAVALPAPPPAPPGPPPVTPPPAPPPVVLPYPLTLPSPPVGANPMFLITPARRATWAAEKQLGHPWYQLALDNCAKTGTTSERYGDDGGWCALVAVMEHDSVAAQKAYHHLMSDGVMPPDANTMRERGEKRVIAYTWIAPQLSQVQRDSLWAFVVGWARWGIHGTGVQYVGGNRSNDEDQSTASWFTGALVDAASRGTIAATHFLADTMDVVGFNNFPMGSLGSIDPTSERVVSIEYEAGMCTGGGEGRESTEYNPGTTVLMMLGHEGLKTSYGMDYLPTFATCFRQMAQQVAWAFTQDMTQQVQWGDVQAVRFPPISLNAIQAGAVQGLTGDPVAGGLVARILAKYGAVGYGTSEPSIGGAWMVALYNPYAPIDSTPRQGAWIAAGRGHLFAQQRGSLFFGEAQPPTGGDHQVNYSGNFQLYRHGEWVIQNPVCYASCSVAAGTNGPSYAGLGAMETKTFDGADSSVAGRWCITGSTGGPVEVGRYDEPAPFLTLGRRTTCYSQVSGIDIITTHDSVVMGPVTRVARYAQLGIAVDSALGWVAIFHPQSIPVQAGNVWTWTTLGGQTVTLTATSDGVISADPLLDDAAVLGLTDGPTFAVDGMPTWDSSDNPTLGKQLRLRTTGLTLSTIITIH